MSHLLASFALIAATGLALVPPIDAALQRGRGAPADGSDGAQRGPGAGRRATTPAPPPSDTERGAPRTPRVDLAARYFQLCDTDSNGWISFREARDALDIENPVAFSVFDANGDGMCEQSEFRARYDAVLARGGAFRPPRTADSVALEGGYTIEALLELYDADADERIDRREILRAFAALGILDLDGKRVVEDLDGDGSGRLEGREIEALGPLFEGGWKRYGEAAPTTLAELFGTPVPRVDGDEGFVPEPPLIVGPIPAFRRLDLDDDGGITLSDLEELRRPLKPRVRLEAVMAVLDTNADGRIDSAELRASMMRPR